MGCKEWEDKVAGNEYSVEIGSMQEQGELGCVNENDVVKISLEP